MNDPISDMTLRRVFGPANVARIQCYLTSFKSLSGPLIREGEAQADLVFLERGRVQIIVAGTSDALTELEAPQVFGEIGVLTGAKASASVDAQDPVDGYRLSLANFKALQTDEPDLSAALVSFLAQTLAHRLAATDRQLMRFKERQSESLSLGEFESQIKTLDFSAEFAAVDLDDVWDASFEL